jgi:hypothetical protein
MLLIAVCTFSVVLVGLGPVKVLSSFLKGDPARKKRKEEEKE